MGQVPCLPYTSLACRCGHCKHLTPEYKTLGAAVAKDASLKNRVVIAKVGTCQLMVECVKRFIPAASLAHTVIDNITQCCTG